MSPVKKDFLKQWWENIRSGATKFTLAQSVALSTTKELRLSEKLYGMRMKEFFHRYNHPALLGGLVLAEKWVMVAANQNGNIID